jgi:dihydrofolate reductase
MSTAKPVTGPRLEFVVAVARNGVIGRDNGLPWRLPADLAHFKRITFGHPVLMGRRTWQSIGRPLPGRRNLVLTRDADFRADGAEVVHSLAAALGAVPAGARLMVIGGAELYRETLAAAEVLHLTEVEADVEGDARFPEWRREEWQEISREAHPADERHTYPYSFVTLTRRGP